MPDLGLIGETKRESWMLAITVYKAFQEYFASAIQGEQEAVRQQLQLLESYVGEDAYQDIFRAISEMVQTSQESGRGLIFSITLSFLPTSYKQ